jgi:hypothetical protein
MFFPSDDCGDAIFRPASVVANRYNHSAGHTAANRATRQAENVEAPSPPAQHVTAAQVLQQADELVSLAQQVRTDTEHATRGLLAKDLKDKLKRIEKISKQLRQELILQ